MNEYNPKVRLEHLHELVDAPLYMIDDYHMFRELTSEEYNDEEFLIKAYEMKTIFKDA